MTTAIFNIDKTGIEKPVLAENFSGSKEELINRLYDLQLEYCESEKPKIVIMKTGIAVESDSDFIHIAKV